LGQDRDVSDCANVFPPNGTCIVRCAGDYHGEKAVYSCLDADEGLVGEGPTCKSSTTSTTTTTTTTTQTVQTTTMRVEGELTKNVSMLEFKLGRYGKWSEEAGFPDDCEEGFKAPDAPLLATDFNGVQLPPVCFKKKGPHKVFVIGDWGGVLGPHGPAPADQRAKEDFVKGVDDIAQKKVAGQMRARAAQHAPDYILNAGDNFYWAGLDTKCGLVPAYQITPTGQFQWTFEHIYTGEGLDKKPWLGVLGNHDYGGYMFNKGWDQIIAYTWGPGGRWVMPGQYWRTKVHYPGFSVDYWFVDTNAFEAHEPHADPEHNICSKEHVKEDEGCGKEGPEDVWHCPTWFKQLWDDQVPWLEKGLKESKADWQIVVTHFPPTWHSDFWVRLSREYGIDLIVTGHMHHQEMHYEDPANFLYPTAWMISGGGGGITSDGTPNVDGIDDQYGFYELTLTKEIIEVQGISHGGYVRSHAFVTPRKPGEVRHLGHPKQVEHHEERHHEGGHDQEKHHDERHGLGHREEKEEHDNSKHEHHGHSDDESAKEDATRRSQIGTSPMPELMRFKK